MTKWASLLAAASICAACGGWQREPAYRELTLLTGTMLRVELGSAMASDGSRVEDPVLAELRQAVSIDGREVLRVGTALVGTVTAVEQSGRVKGRARVAYRFSSLDLEGQRYQIATAPLSHRAVGGGSGGEDVVPATRGKEVRVGPGANVTTQLTGQLTIRMTVGSGQ